MPERLKRIADDRFEVRLARDEDEVRASQRLRYRVFVEELGAHADPQARAERLESDRFDADADHLVLIDRAATPADPLDRVVGVYRLIRGSVAGAGIGFYSASEYDLSPLLESGRSLVELGRSCVAAEYRGGAATHLLWEGLARYVIAREIEILFGVASFHGTDLDSLAPALSLLHHEYLAPEELRVRAIGPNRAEMDRLPREAIDRRRAMVATPALIKAYLRLGGRVGDGAYVDHAFNTTDVCLIMDTGRMADRYRRIYVSDES